MIEIWKDIKDYEEHYQVSNLGNIRSKDKIITCKGKNGTIAHKNKKGKVLKNNIQKGTRSNIQDMLYVVLSKEGKTKRFYVHRLVADAFMPNSDRLNKTEVNHIDGNRYNNTVSNLEWVTKKDNIKHAFKNKLIKTEKEVIQIDATTYEEIKVFPSESSACRSMGVTQGKINRAIKRNGTCKGYKWRFK